ncbi:HEAT repeat domain-containing protein [Ktedonobacteria bacterium brp13]|nr:HEAT repeat domain-containing protein [Ktedonobacteria bacterium brp13]
MPRGRKGSPQESVDSILLAISRRDDIDTETMSHYLDRLDEEWAEGAREKVLHLLRSSDGLAQAAALRVLAELATDFDLEGLEDFVADPTVSDLAKLSLSPILKELGSEIADDGLVEYLNDPAGAIRQMQLRLLEMVGQNEMGIETILEDVVSMPVERRFAFISWLGNSNDPRAANLLVPLLENQSGKVVQAVIEALEQLGPIAINLTIPALNHVIATTSNRQTRQQARATLGRLTMQSMLGSEDAVMMEQSLMQQLPPYQARVSALDGSGTQLIMLSWLRPDGLVKGVNVLFHDQKGIKDCYGVDEMDKEQWQALVHDLDEQGFTSFTVPFDFARMLVIDARALNRRTRTKLPIAYSIWRPITEAGLSPHIFLGNGAVPSRPKKGSQIPVVAELLPVNDETQLQAQKEGAGVHQWREFASWLYEPVEQVEPYISHYWSAQNAAESHKRGGRRELQAVLERLVDEATRALINEKWCALYSTRLRRQAALYQQVGRETDATVLRAVATLLLATDQVPAYEQAFPRAVLRLSIEQGPLRLMMESLRSGTAIPFL